MKNAKTIRCALLNAVGVVVYVMLIGWVMTNMERIAGPMEEFWGPVAFLLLFVLSAAIVGALVLGKPALLYLDGEKKEALRTFFYTLGFLLLAVAIVVVYIAS
jgi:membrane protease YdiL (CAAX protease family)